MQLTRFTDYAFRVLMYAHAADDRLVTIEEVALAYDISRAHLMKVVSALSRAGLLAAVRGRTGGFKLGRSAAKIRLGDVVRVTEPDFSLVECFSTEKVCAIDGCCRLPVVLRRALRAFLAELDRDTIASVALRPADFQHVFMHQLGNAAP